jgi:hypothetical protein
MFGNYISHPWSSYCPSKVFGNLKEGVHRLSFQKLTGGRGGRITALTPVSWQRHSVNRFTSGMDLSSNNQPAKVITLCSCERAALPFLPSACSLNPKTQTFVYPWLELVDTDVKSKGELGLSGGGSETSLAVMADTTPKQWMNMA